MNQFKNNMRYRKYYYYKGKNIQQKLKRTGFFVAICVVLLVVTVFYAVKDGETGKSTSMSVSEHHEQERISVQDNKPLRQLISENIRVVIKTGDFKEIVHNNIQMTSTTGLTVFNEDRSICINVNVGEVLDFSNYEQLRNTGMTIHVETVGENDAVNINSVKRSCGYPSYYGKFDIYCEAGGYVIVNEVPLEYYLYGVVPSEMPDSYDIEALKAQAVCARSYAVRRMGSIAYPEYNAAVDDSVRYQVYNNYEITEKIKEAVDATKGCVAVYNGEVIDAYFYATSCGITGGGEVWSAESAGIEYLKSVQLCSNRDGISIEDENELIKYIDNCDTANYDSDSPWYRWQIKLDTTKLDDEWVQKYGALKDIVIVDRSAGGIITGLKVIGEKGEMLLSSEYDIRNFFGKMFLEGQKQNGKISNITMLPSACFYIASREDNIITLKGGGYGHGVGLSQTAADSMAKSGMKYSEIISFFYPGTEISDECSGRN